jgi:hypothetical protein
VKRVGLKQFFCDYESCSLILFLLIEDHYLLYKNMIRGTAGGNRSLLAPIMIVRDLRAFAFDPLSGQPNPLVAFIHSNHRRAIMNFVLFVLESVIVLEIVLIVVGIGIALVPTRSVK